MVYRLGRLRPTPSAHPSPVVPLSADGCKVRVGYRIRGRFGFIVFSRDFWVVPGLISVSTGDSSCFSTVDAVGVGLIILDSDWPVPAFFTTGLVTVITPVGRVCRFSPGTVFWWGFRAGVSLGAGVSRSSLGFFTACRTMSLEFSHFRPFRTATFCGVDSASVKKVMAFMVC